MARWVEHAVLAIAGFIAALGYAGVFALMAIESACIPIPSEVTLIFSGFLVGQGRFNLWITLGTALAGALVGSTISYSIGRYCGKPFLSRYGRYVLLTEHRLAAAEAWFTRYGGNTVVLLRWVGGIRALVSLPAGMVRMPYPRFILLTLLGTGTWVVFGVVLGMIVGEEWQRITHLVKQANYLILLGLIMIVIAIWLVHCVVRRVAAASEGREG